MPAGPMSMDRVVPTAWPGHPRHCENAPADAAEPDRGAVYRIGGHILIEGVLHGIRHLLFADASFGVINKDVFSIGTVPANSPA